MSEPRFFIHPAVFRVLHRMRVVTAVALGVGEPGEDVGPELVEAWRFAGAEGLANGNAQSHPRVAPWRPAFRAIGAHPRDYTSSVEAMVRRATKGGDPPRIHPLVDLYHAVSLRHSRRPARSTSMRSPGRSSSAELARVTGSWRSMRTALKTWRPARSRTPTVRPC